MKKDLNLPSDSVTEILDSVRIPLRTDFCQRHQLTDSLLLALFLTGSV